MPDGTQEIVEGLALAQALELGGALVAGFLVGVVLEWLAGRAAGKLSSSGLLRSVLASLRGPLRWLGAVAGVWGGLIAAGLRIGPQSAAYLIASALPWLTWLCLRLVDALTDRWRERAAATEGTFDDQLVPVVRTAGRVLVVTLGAILFAQNLGAEVGSLLAGFGIGGVAVAMAAKDTIANLFGSLVIFVDRPFQIGDWVEIGENEGTVEEVGLRVTRIRTFANSLITVPNASLTTSPINNWSRMKKRRIKLTLGLTYDTNAEQMRDAVEAIRQVLRDDDRIDQSFFLVNFTNFGGSSLDIFVYCFTTTTRWDEYMQVRQEILLEFMRAVEHLGLGFAFPTQSLHIESLPPEFRQEVRS